MFGSEAKAVLEHPAVPRDLDEDAFGDYLTFGFTPPPSTLFRGVGKLGPGERMVVTADGAVTTETWWDPMPPAAVAERAAAMSEDEMVAEVRRLLRESVGKRMMSDVPFGVFLSGGLDSSTNVALMAELSDAPVRTYSTAPRGHARYDELAYARIVAERFCTEHHEVLVDEQEMRDFLPEMLFHQDEPLSDWTAVPQHFVTRLARETGHDRRAGRRGRRRALPRLPRLRRPPADHRADPAVAAPARAPRDRRRGGAGDDAARARRPPWRGPLRRRAEPDPVLGRRTVLPRAAQGARPPRAARATRWRRSRGSGTRRPPALARPTCSRA